MKKHAQDQSPDPSLPKLTPQAAREAYRKRMENRQAKDLFAQHVYALFGSVLFGLIYAMFAFAFAYAGTSVLGRALFDLFIGYTTTITKFILPAMLAPYSNFILFATPAAFLLMTLHYAYSTDTLGFRDYRGKKAFQKAMDTLSLAAPLLAYGLAMAIGVSPMLCFKISWGTGIASCLYMTIGKHLVAHFFPDQPDEKQEQHGQKSDQDQEEAPAVQPPKVTPIARQAKNPKNANADVDVDLTKKKSFVPAHEANRKESLRDKDKKDKQPIEQQKKTNTRRKKSH